MVQLADQVFASSDDKDSGPRFYYVDERDADGSPMFEGTMAEVHAQAFLGLAEGWRGVPWVATPVEGKGYVEFARTTGVLNMVDESLEGLSVHRRA